MPHIIYGIDEKYLPCLIVSMYSLLKTTGESVRVTIFVVGEEQQFSVIHTLAKHFPNAVVEVRSFSSDILVDYERTDIAKRFPTASLIPVFVPALIDGKCLFIDADTLILKDVSKLFHISMNGFPIGAVQHYQLSVFYNFASSTGISDLFLRARKLRIRQSVEERATRLGFTINDFVTKYFSSGVILFDTSVIRKDWGLDMLEVVDQTKKYWNHFPDEEFFNTHFKNYVHYFELKWNVPKDFSGLMGRFIPSNLKEEIYTAVNNPSILHFANIYKNKPWDKPWFRSRKRYRIYKEVCQEIHQRTGINVKIMFEAKQ